jgi:hypothetical protein
MQHAMRDSSDSGDFGPSFIHFSFGNVRDLQRRSRLCHLCHFFLQERGLDSRRGINDNANGSYRIES